MPTLDFLGFDAQQKAELNQLVKSHLNDLPFSKDIVLVQRSDNDTQIVDLQGIQHPFLRIYTRSKEKAEMLVQCLSDYVDIEVILFDSFYPKRSFPK